LQTLQMHKPPVAFVILAGIAVAQPVSQKPESWLGLQSVHVAGDTAVGFRKSCVSVYPDGEYHREVSRQVSRGGRPQFEWEPPEVFESKLAPTDLNALQTILGNPEFSSINGVVGDSRGLMSKLVLDRQGGVRPHENIEFVTVAVSKCVPFAFSSPISCLR
jgi:hypothetical protein